MCNALIREACDLCVVMKLNRKLCFNLFLLTESSIWEVAWVWGNHQLAEANGCTSSLSVLAGGHGRLRMTVLRGRLSWPLWRVDSLSKDRKHPHDKYSQSTELRSWRTWKHFYAFYCSIAAMQRLKDEGCEVNKPNKQMCNLWCVRRANGFQIITWSWNQDQFLQETSSLTKGVVRMTID